MLSIKIPRLHNILAFIVLCTSVAVMIGWILHFIPWLQVTGPFAPMYFNTAFLFCLIALGILFAERTYYKIKRICAVAVIVFASVTLSQYPLGASFGIDTFFIKPILDNNVEPWGRMAASTAIAMILAGIALFFNKRTLLGQFVRVIGCSLLLGFGAIGIAGYFFDLNSQYGWGSFTRMVPLTSISFLIIASSLIIQTYDKIKAGPKGKLKHFAVLGVGVLCSLALSQWILVKDYQRNKSITEIRADALLEGFDNTFYPLQKALEHMARRFALGRYQSQEQWDIDASSYVDDFVGMKRLTWIDKDMVTQWAFPMVGVARRLVGANILEEKDVAEVVQWVLKNKKPSLSNVIELKSGGPGFVMFVPILKDDQVIGLLSAAVRADVFFNRVVQAPGYFVNINDNGRTVMSTGTPQQSYARDWSYKVNYTNFNSSWQVVITPSPDKVQANTSYMPLLTIIFGTVVSILLALSLLFSQNSRESEKKMKEALDWQEAGRDSVPMMMIQLDSQAHVMSINKATEDLLGYSKEEVIGRFPFMMGEHSELVEIRGKLEALLHRPVPEGKEFVEALFETKFNVGMERVLVGKDGQRFNVILSINRITTDNEVSGYLAVAEDITQKKERERLLKEQEEKFLVSSRLASLGEMAAGIAHEINNPLAIMNGYVSVLRKNLQQKGLSQDADVNRRLDSIETTVHRIAKIVRGLRSYAHGAHDGDLEEVKVETIIDDTLAFCHEKFKNDGIKLVARIEPGLVVKCRAHQISQVLLNLLNNSYDAVHNVDQRFVTIEAQAVDDGVEVSVTDSGPGIPFEKREKIMQPFFTTKEVGKGVGLGLSISQGILQAHNGKLYLDPQSPETRFVFWLPTS